MTDTNTVNTIFSCWPKLKKLKYQKTNKKDKEKLILTKKNKHKIKKNLVLKRTKTRREGLCS